MEQRLQVSATVRYNVFTVHLMAVSDEDSGALGLSEHDASDARVAVLGLVEHDHVIPRSTERRSL